MYCAQKCIRRYKKCKKRKSTANTALAFKKTFFVHPVPKLQNEYSVMYESAGNGTITDAGFVYIPLCSKLL